MYRRGVLALYGNEQSYSAAQHALHGGLNGGSNNSNGGFSYVEQELRHLRASHAAELALLEAEL